MLKKTIRYTDFNGVEREEDLYFNLSEAELLEMAVHHEMGVEGVAAFFKGLGERKDPKEVIPAIKNLLILAYGERSEDGKYFRKGEDITDNFVSSAAYHEMFMQMMSDADTITSFFKGALPSKYLAAMEVLEREHTVEELVAMSDEQFELVVGTDTKKMSKPQLSALMARHSRNREVLSTS